MSVKIETSHEIDQYLKDLDRLVSSIETDSAVLTSAVSGFVGGLSQDARCTIERSGDNMTATAEFFPATGQGLALSREAFLAQLQSERIVHGYLVPPGKTPTSGRYVVARGAAPEDSVAESMAILDDLIATHQSLDDTTLAFDFKTHSPFIQVHGGDRLTRLLAAKAGVLGTNLEGASVPFQEISPVQPKPGKNVVAEGSGFVAGCDGDFRYELGKFWIDKVLRLNSGIGYDTGHIVFDGDVHLQGEVAAGFTIWTQGSLHSTDLIAVSEIVCGGEVITPKGIIGRLGSTLEVAGSVHARFMETTQLKAQLSVEIMASILNCHIQTRDRLIMGPKGWLMGGRVEAQNGIDVFQIGNSQGIKTEVACGTDFTVIDKLEWTRVQSLAMIRQLKTLEGHRKTHHGQEAALAEACGKVRDQVLKLNELSRGLVSMIDQNEGAEVKVRGTVHIGTSIEICRAVLKVDRLRTSVRYFLDKTQGVIREARL